MTPQFVTEPGCPVEVTAANTELEVDPFGAPIAARHYIDYRNASMKPVAAVKFRIGYVGDDGKIQLPYLNAPDAHPLSPGESASQKWRGDKVGSRTKEVKIRVLMVKLADGSIWESAKLHETAAAGSDSAGFQPLQPEAAGTAGWSDNVVADRSPGTPVPLTDTAKNYKSYPDRTQSGSVPFTQVPGTPAAGFQDNAFGGTGAPLTAAPAGGAQPFLGATGVPAPPAAAPPAASGGGFGGVPAAAPPAAFPAAAAPPTPAYTPPPKAPKASDITDPLGTIDSLLGNTSAPTLPNKIVPAPSAAPPATPAPAPAAEAPATAAPAAAAPATAAPATAAPATAAPATAAPKAPAADNTPAPAAAPLATPSGGDDFAN